MDEFSRPMSFLPWGCFPKRAFAECPNFCNPRSEWDLPWWRLIGCRIAAHVFALLPVDPVVRKEDHVMTGSAQYPQRGIACCICSGPIPLETSKADERGQAVHEECYVRKIISIRRTANVIHLAENWLSYIVVKFQLRLRVGNSAGHHVLPDFPRRSSSAASIASKSTAMLRGS